MTTPPENLPDPLLPGPGRDDATGSEGPSDLPRLSLFYRLGIGIIGAIFVVVGIAGLFLPLLQGILMILLGLVLLSLTSPFFDKGLERSVRRWPWMHDKMEELRGKILEYLAER